MTVRDGKAYLEKADGTVSAVPLQRLSIKDLAYLAAMPKYESQVKPFLPDDPTSPASPSPTMATIEVDDPSASGSIRQFRSDRWGYKGLAFSNDGAYLATLGSNNVTVMDINASTKTEYEIDSGNRSSVTFSPDGKRLLAGSFDGNVLVWQFGNEGELKPEKQFSIHQGEIKSIVVSPDNQHVLTTHSPNVACLWELDSGKVLARFNDFAFNSGAAVRFSRYGGHVMMTDGRVAAVIDIASRKIIQRMSLSRGSGQFAVISPDASLISVGRIYDIHFFQTLTGMQSATSKGDETLWSAAFSPNGNRLISGGRENVKLWDAESGAMLQEFAMADSGYVKYVAFSPDGLHFAAIGAPLGKLVEVFRLPQSR
ncbi:WD repeat-containing protein [Rhodopirellula maiorica SM1]|uniref:WD repeat-containing protein n=1 Tax=Rhodopirellula maiorica SM1 TaxID=1265738 RepID=M5RUH5_9BACT|nr:WD repeat-containing protein [Rhodopirellula maiorica SM1]